MSVLERKSISLMLLLELIMVNLSPISTGNLLMVISTFTLNHVTLVTQNLQLLLVRLWEWEEFVLRKVILLPILESLRTGSRKGAIRRIWLTRKRKGPLKVLCSKTSKRSVSVNCGTGVSLVVNYNPILCRLGQVIHKNVCFLYQDEEVKQVFNPAPFVSFRSVRTLRCHLVRAKVYPVGERLVQ